MGGLGGSSSKEYILTIGMALGYILSSILKYQKKKKPTGRPSYSYLLNLNINTKLFIPADLTCSGPRSDTYGSLNIGPDSMCSHELRSGLHIYSSL